MLVTLLSHLLFYSYWGGLHANTQRQCLMDGSHPPKTAHGRWFYAVGSRHDFLGGIPAVKGVEQVVELYAFTGTISP